MTRVGAIVIFAGAVLLSTHMLATAEPPPPPPGVSPAELAAIVRDQPVVQQVNQQVDRLRDRLAAPPAYPPPSRDPFRFGGQTEPARPKTAIAAVAPAPPAPAPVLPKLIAIATNAADGTPVRSAVLALVDDLQIVKAGETCGRFQVRGVEADVVELQDPTTGATFKLSLQ